MFRTWRDALSQTQIIWFVCAHISWTALAGPDVRLEAAACRDLAKLHRSGGMKSLAQAAVVELHAAESAEIK